MSKDTEIDFKALLKEVAQESAASSAKAAVDAMLPVLALAFKEKEKGNAQPRQQLKGEILTMCNECGQAIFYEADGHTIDLKSERGCRGQHAKLEVRCLKYPEFNNTFQGVFINGKRYLSLNPGDLCTVPSSSVGNIISIIQAYEENERVQAVGRKGQGRVPEQGFPQNSLQAYAQGWR